MMTSLEAKKIKWYHAVQTVIAALVLFGPLAYPLLWKSPAFNRFWKIALTAIFTALTVAMLWGTFEIAAFFYRLVRDAEITG